MKPQGLALRGQAEDQVFLVIGKRVLQARHLGVGGKGRLQRLGGGLQGLGLAAVEIDRQRRTARAEERVAKA